MNRIFNQDWKGIAAGATVLAYTSWFDSLKNPKQNLEFKKEVSDNFLTIKNQISELQKQISSNLDEGTKNQLNEKINELTNQLQGMENIHKNYFNKFENVNISTNSEGPYSMYNNYKAQIDEAFKKAKQKATEISDIIDNSSSSAAGPKKFIDDNPIFNVINEFKEYLGSLSTMEICLIINISSCVFIITCIIGILYAISGNYLIDKFSLEQKLPKLSKLIQLRVKFQRYYVTINSVFIILAVLSLIFINTVTLIIG